MSKSLNFKFLIKSTGYKILLLLISTAVACSTYSELEPKIDISSAPGAYIDKSAKIAVVGMQRVPSLYSESEYTSEKNTWLSESIQSKLLSNGFNVTEYPINAKYLVQVMFIYKTAYYSDGSKSNYLFEIIVRVVEVKTGKLLLKYQRSQNFNENTTDSVYTEIEKLVKKEF